MLLIGKYNTENAPRDLVDSKLTGIEQDVSPVSKLPKSTAPTYIRYCRVVTQVIARDLFPRRTGSIGE